MASADRQTSVKQKVHMAKMRHAAGLSRKRRELERLEARVLEIKDEIKKRELASQESPKPVDSHTEIHSSPKKIAPQVAEQQQNKVRRSGLEMSRRRRQRWH